MNNDLISRQAAIDAIDKRFDDVPMELTTEILQLRHDLRERIPSAQPATNCSEIPNSSDDTISRQAAIDALDEQIEQCNKALSSFDISPKDEYAIKVERASLKAYRELLENLPSAQPEPTQEIQDILDYLNTVLHPIVSPEHWDVYSRLHDMVSSLPYAQLDGIPLEWIDKHLEWLDNCDNDFAQLAKVSIKAMVELWKKDMI